MMKLRAMELLAIEQECVARGTGYFEPDGSFYQCDRDCSKCDLVQDSTELLEMYDYVRDLIEGKAV